MALEDKIENLYLNIWKGLVLFLATIALIVAVLASAGAVNGLFDREPFQPVEVKVENQGEALKQELSFDAFKNSDSPGSERQATKGAKPDPGRELANFVDEALQKISSNLDSYSETAFPGQPPNRDAIKANIRNAMKDVALTNAARVKFYLSTLGSLSDELLKTAKEQTRLPEDKRISIARLLRWHAETMEGALQAMDHENEKLQKTYRQQLVDYANKHARIVSYVGVAAGAFAIFVFTVFLFVIIKIERDLRMMAVASMLTTKQLEA